MSEALLPPIKERPEDYDDLLRMIAKLFKEEIYLPLIRSLGAPTNRLDNSLDDLARALLTGRLRFEGGAFRGKFSSVLSKELKRIGAQWDRKQGSFRIPLAKVPVAIRAIITEAEHRYQKTLAKTLHVFESMDPVKIAEKLKAHRLFDQVLSMVDSKVQKTLKGIAVAPQLSPAERERIAAEYTKSIQLHIQDWTGKEIVELRKRIEERAFAGHRYESIIGEIQKSYGVSYGKAKFLARQETSLLMTKFKQVRYQDAGSEEYLWGCVAGSPKHPVRPMHKKNEGKRFRWDTGATVDDTGVKKNPGQDYNCRCYARPVVRF